MSKPVNPRAFDLLRQIVLAIEGEEWRVAATALTNLMEFCREQSGEKNLGLFRGVDCKDSSGYFYLTHLGSLWELKNDEWFRLLERIIDERGYALSEFGLCLSYEVHDLSAITKSKAEQYLRNL